jgi:hypothetical protein
MVLVLLSQSIAQTQTINPAPRNEPHRFQTPQELTTARIANLIRSQLPISNLRIPLVQRMGDAAAIEIQNIMKTRGALSPTEEQNVLQILPKALASPGAIMKDSSCKPDASMALLEQMSSHNRPCLLGPALRS